MKQIRFLSLLALTVVMIGCAKEKSYEETPKHNVTAKSLIGTDANDPYVYLPSTGESPMTISAAIPYFIGDEKLATFRFEENELVAVQLPDDERFAANTSNQSPILRVEINHKDYRCQEDSNGECGNKEEENENASWRDRRYFEADFSKLVVAETNSLPEQTAAAFTRCFGDGEQVVRNVKIEKDSILIHIQKRWKASVVCANFENVTSFSNLLRDTTYTVNYHYSFVKLSKLKAANYQAINYPFEDQNTFGFFKRELNRLSPDGRSTLNSETHLMARWNPNRKEIKYHLSDAFYQPNREAVLRATEQAVATINNSFERGGIDMRITLHDGRGKDPGDLNYSFLVLVDDPNATGILGYGPTVANPRTGEILKANTMMYYGNLTRLIETTYDDLVAEQQRANAQRAAQGNSASIVLPAENTPVSAAAASAIQINNLLNRDIINAGRISGPAQVRGELARRNQFAGTTIRNGLTHNWRRESQVGSGRVELREWLERLAKPETSDEMRLKALTEQQSHHCFYQESLVNMDTALAASISEANLGDNLKPWIELSEDEQEEVIQRLMPTVYVGTLVHELGHNLGLRHNFSGSEDNENYYSEAERRSLGISRPVTYSSVMAYAYSELNQLPVMGKSDIAALKFGYKREVELTDGTTVVMPVEQTFEALRNSGQVAAGRRTEQDNNNVALNAKLKSFQYCTDEHVEVNAGCNRNDEGQGPLAIAQHYVNAYKKNIPKVNFRNNRARFSIVNDGSYYGRMNYTFEALRRFFEQYDRLKSNPQWAELLSMTEAEWDAAINGLPEAQRSVARQNKQFFLGVSGAAHVAVDFFLEILTMPDMHCSVAEVANPTVIAATVPLKVLSPDGEAFDCADSERIGINPLYKVVGQTGRYFNHQRHEHLLPGQLRAAADELSVRGIWMDKLLAVKWLTERELDNTVFDEFRAAPVDYPEFGDKIRAAFAGYITDTLVSNVEVKMFDGTSRMLQVAHKPSDSHTISNRVLMPFHARRGLTRVETDFRALMFPMIKRSLRAADNISLTAALTNTLSVYQIDPISTFNPETIAGIAEFRDGQGQLIARFLASREHTAAAALIRQRDYRKILEAVTEEQLETAFNQISSNQVPAEIPEALRPLYTVPTVVMQAFAQGNLPSDEKLLALFRAMAAN